MRFLIPVPITFPNVDGLPPGEEVDIWSLDPELGEFAIVGTGQVSADGSRIETVSGGIRAADWHAAMPPQLLSSNRSKRTDPNNPCPQCGEKKGSSTFSLNDGHMGTRFTLPAYRSLEASRALTFNYRTFRAFPRPVIEAGGVVARRSAVPPLVSYRLSVGGVEQGTEVYVSTEGFSESADEPFRAGVTFDASAFSSGMHRYALRLTSNFASGTRISRVVDELVMVVNEQANPFGAGWMLEGLFELAFNDDGSVTLIAPGGRSINYLPDPVSGPGTFVSPDNDFATFVRNPDGSYLHTEKNGVEMHFDADGRITSHEDRNHNATRYAYDGLGRLQTLTDPVGRVTTFVYGPDGKLATVTDPAGRVSAFDFDLDGNLVKLTYPDGTFERYEYDERHLMTAHTDELGNRSTDRYDAFGRVIDGTLPDGTVRAVASQDMVGVVDVSSGLGTIDNPAGITRPEAARGEYVDGRGNPSVAELDPHGRATMTVDEVGRITDHQRDADSNPTRTTRPIGSVVVRTFDDHANVLTEREEFNGATTIYTYDPFSLVTSVQNPNGHRTVINRDNQGNPVEIVNHLGHTTTLEYDNRGLVTRKISPNQLESSYTYGADGLLATQTETPPAGSPGNVRITQYSYHPTGLLAQVTTPDLIVLDYLYDERNSLVSVTDNLNQSIVYSYDAHKNVIATETHSADGSLALLVQSVYDNRNRLLETRAPHLGPEDSVTTRLLDENSNLVGLIDPNGNASSNRYDPFDRLVENTHRLDGKTTYEYDDQDRITRVIAPNGVTTDYTYDIIGRRLTETSPDRGTMRYRYDLANNVLTVTDGREITATMTYDDLERAATKTYPNTFAGKDESVTYIYDNCPFGLGSLCARTDESGRHDYDYDAFGNLTAMDFTETAGVVYTTAYVYDDGDNVVRTTLPSGRVIDVRRDGGRRIEAIDTTVNGLPQPVIAEIAYRGDNQITQCTFGNTLTDRRTYDLQGRLTHQILQTPANVIIDERTYTHDKNSNLLAIDTNYENNTYTYDPLDRLTTDTINLEPPVDYTYDLNDNRLTQTRGTTENTTYSYAADTNRLIQAQSLELGSLEPLEALPDRDLVFNDANRLYQLYEDGVLVAEYTYNDEGQRTRKVVFLDGGVTETTIYHYDRSGHLITETREDGALIRDYIWTEDMQPVVQIDSAGGTESIIYLHTDHLMTGRLATDDGGTVVWRWEGDAFGATEALGDPDGDLVETVVNLRFPGQYFDGETGLHYNWWRYFDPSLGSYIRSDPLGLAGGGSTYVYGNANPNTSLDINGLITWYAVGEFVIHASIELWMINEKAEIKDGELWLLEGEIWQAEHQLELIDSVMERIDERDLACRGDCIDQKITDPCYDIQECFDVCHEEIYLPAYQENLKFKEFWDGELRRLRRLHSIKSS